jgi:polyphosphate:AMP phosphotransferase
MFEVAEVGNKTDKETYKREEPKLRADLLAIQRELAESSLAPVVILSGSDELGKEQTVDLLLEWLDARGIATHVLGELSDEERERPRFWRFWRALPPRGHMAILLGSWYTDAIVERVYHRIDDIAFEREMRRIRDFERMLGQEGVPVVKFWLHLAKDVQKKRLEKLKKDPAGRWLVTDEAWIFVRKYGKFRRVSEKAVGLTSTDTAQWHIVESVDARYRNLAVASTLLRTLRETLDESKAQVQRLKAARRPDLPAARKINVIRELDLSRQLTDQKYERELARLQTRLPQLIHELGPAERAMILVFEGPDAAGKGGAIRRMTGVVHARFYQVVSTAAPTDEERAHPYLWRFWRNLPRRGRVTIYDRSWYGRVLVERIEGFAARDEWSRAYAEINDFEAQLTESGTAIIKFWLAISPEEQLRRFKDRQTTPYKQYKLTEEDWRNRKKWEAYETAACDMIARTSTDDAPWVLVEAEDKRWARIKVMRTVCERLETLLGR